jgi:RNA recognition motif-containing protein
LQFTNPVDALNAVELLNGKIFGDKEIRARLDRGSRGSFGAAPAPAPAAASAAAGESKPRVRKAERAAVDPDAPKQVDTKRVFVSNLTWDTTEEVTTPFHEYQSAILSRLISSTSSSLRSSLGFSASWAASQTWR